MSKKCIYCGSPLPDTASFCPSCAKSQIWKRKLQGPMISHRLLFAIAILLLVIIAALVLPRIFKQAEPEIPEEAAVDSGGPTVDMDLIRQKIRANLDEKGTDYGTDLFETQETVDGITVTHVFLNAQNICTYYTEDNVFVEAVRYYPRNSARSIGSMRAEYRENLAEAASFWDQTYDIEYTEFYPSGVPSLHIGGHKWDSTEGIVKAYDEQYKVIGEYEIPDTKAYLDTHRLRWQDVAQEYTEQIEAGEIPRAYH